MPKLSSTVRGRELGNALRTAIANTDFSSSLALAERLDWDPSKLSVLLNGKGGVSAVELGVLLGKFREVMQRTFDRGLWHKLGASRPYDELADVLGPEVYDALAGLQADPLGADVPVRQQTARELKASTVPGPGYTQDAALELIRNRYANLQPVVRFTLRRLAADARFMAIARMLRGEGRRDWHLLTAIANHVANCRFAWAGLQLSSRTPETARRAMELAQRPEEQGDPQVPCNRFTESALRFALQGAVLSTLQILDLH
ncbi:MAG TPA: hypothetical protein VF821_17050 [Lentzea sp.]